MSQLELARNICHSLNWLENDDFTTLPFIKTINNTQPELALMLDLVAMFVLLKAVSRQSSYDTHIESI